MNEIYDNSYLVFKVVMVHFVFFVMKKGLIFYLTNSIRQIIIENVSLYIFSR